MPKGAPYKFQEKFTTLQKARPMTQRRTCWSTCYVCKMTWDETGTEYLALMNLIISGKHETRFACDNCTITLKNTTP